MKTLYAAAVLAAASMGFGTAANAAYVFDSLGDTFVIDFNGYADQFSEWQDGAGTPAPGLTSRLTLELTGGLGSNTLLFSYLVENTSDASIWDDARVSAFGFDVLGAFDSGSATGDFSIIGGGNAPQGFGSVDICFRAGGGGGGCSGGGGGGVGLLEAGSSGTLSLVFDNMVNSTELSRLYVRYQSLDSRELGVQGDSGIGVPTDVIPEPATWAMMIAGFGLVGSAMRRRRGVSHVSA